MDAYGALIFLSQFGTDPGFWWMWEAVAIFVWWINRVSKSLNCNRYLVMQWTGAGFRKIAERWVPKGRQRWGSKQGRTNQPAATAYTEAGFFSDHGVIFTDDRHTLPMKVTLEVAPHNPHGKGEKYTVNPNVEDIEDSIGRNFVRQIVRSNSVGALGLTAVAMLVIGGIGFALGVLGAPYVLPHPAAVP